MLLAPQDDRTKGLGSRRALAPPQPCRGNIGAVADRLELEPHHRFDYPFAARESAETAISRGDDALAVADGGHRLFDPPRHHLRMLDEIARRLHHAGDEDHVFRKRHALERRIFVRMAKAVTF